MTTDAFGSRRVTLSLTAIARHLDNGAQIAGGVPPGQIAKLNLQRTPSTPSPRLTKVLWQPANSRVIQLGTGPTKCDVKVSGDNLEDIKVFKLVGAGSGATYFQAKTISNQQKTDFEASFQVKDPSPVFYDAWVINAAGQTFLLENACSIELPPLTEPKPGLQLGALFPNAGNDNSPLYAVLVVLTGNPTEFFISDLDGKKDGAFKIELLTEKAFITKPGCRHDDIQNARKLGKAPDLALLEIQIPSLTWSGGEAMKTFCLVAKSTAPDSEDRLAFFVRSLK